MTTGSAPEPLNPMTFPLHGARLIEASAGTGKTFTIAGLYLRLILGHGDAQSRHNTPLSVDQILVVTFTEAATAELRDRIRRRIHEARVAFNRGVSDDPVIAPLLVEITDHQYAQMLLLQAERQMDEAAVYTIHGFCQRMLTQNAFESGSRFDNEFVTDESHLKAQVVADYWRRSFSSLSLTLAAEVRRIWRSPAELLADIGHYLHAAPLTLATPASQDELAVIYQRHLERLESVKSAWRECEAEIPALIADSGVNKRSYSKSRVPTWVASVSAWAQRDTTSLEMPKELEHFSQQVLNEKTPSGTPPCHPVFEIIEILLAEPPELKTALLGQAITQCRTLLAQAKQQKQWLSFDDLLSQLSAALDQDEQGLLAARIRHLYPVAMIDEFQDTDPLQYSIFSRLYLPESQCGLFMIGDPKQAIYAFRGADIFTYIKARNQVSAHYTLGTNWRSSAQMVEAVNQLFQQADSPFIYDADIPFYPVQASPKAAQNVWTLAGEEQPALTYWHLESDDELITKGEYQQAMAAATASQIQTILTAAQQGEAQLCRGDESEPIQAGDIAVLVRTGSEGRRIKQALAQQGIASVYLSNRDSVFTSSVAQDVLYLLQAVLTPDQDRALRAALASPLFALDAVALDALNNDENEWETTLNEFKAYRSLWSQRGVLPMLRAVMSQRQIAERLLEEDQGERVLTDLMHLGELLQQAQQEIDSDHGLLRWLAQMIRDAELGRGGSDEQIQRLESERNLVQIVTIHKSKGLEYDLVFLPFALNYRAASEGKYYDPQREQTVLDLHQDSAALLQADKERLAEDLRLIYVALTRAVFACFVGVAPLRKGQSTKPPSGVHYSALGYLLQNGQEGGVAELRQALEAQQSSSVVIADLPVLSSEPYQPAVNETPNLNANVLHTPLDRWWRLTSYSALVKQGGQHRVHDAALEVSGFDVDSADERKNDEPLQPERSIFTFPRGARPGTFLHSLFEQIEFTQPAESEHNTRIVTELMLNEQLELEWLPILQQLINTVLATPLDGDALCLNEKTAEQRLVEMEFLLPIEVLNAAALHRVAQEHDALSAMAGELGFHTVQGMLKGFIDLVFEHQGRYYVLDWKSNYLGDQVGDYQQNALQQAMIEHRYDLQYQLYALALHRFLRSRLANYDYQHHFGGVYYLFLRGMDGDAQHGIFRAKPSEAFLDELDRLIDGQSIASVVTSHLEQ